MFSSTDSSPNQNWSGTIFTNNVYGDDDDIVRSFAQRFGVSAKDLQLCTPCLVVLKSFIKGLPRG